MQLSPEIQKIKERIVSNYSELTHSVGNERRSFKNCKIKVSNYSELTHSVGPFLLIVGDDPDHVIRVSNYSELTHSVGTEWSIISFKDSNGKVSNYSELTHSVGRLRSWLASL